MLRRLPSTWMPFALLLMLALPVAVPVFAEDWVAPGPNVGSRFSAALDLEDQTGHRRSLTDVMGRRGVTLVFVRSADWCPFCKRQLAELNALAPEFDQLGYPLVSISVDTVPLIQKFAEQVGVRFTMLADPKGDLNERLGIRDAQYPLGSAAFGVPHPGLFVIDRSGVIRAKHFEKGYRTRPDPQQVLASIRALGAAAEAR